MDKHTQDNAETQKKNHLYKNFTSKSRNSSPVTVFSEYSPRERQDGGGESVRWRPRR